MNPVSNSLNPSQFPEEKSLVYSLEEFKEYLCWYSADKEEDIQKTAKRLFKIVPKNLELQELVNLVFEQSHNGEAIIRILDAISFMHPSFTLSPYDQIRRAIIEDKQIAITNNKGPTLTNRSFTDMLKEHGFDKNEEKITAFYELAYRFGHPYIYPLSQTTIPPNDYTINFLWVNLNPQDRIKDLAENIFKDGRDLFENAESIKDPNALRRLEKMEKEQSLEKDVLENWTQIKQSFTYRISKWADANPKTQINLWYDSALVTQKAQQKTFVMMKNISQSRGVDLKLRDVRKLPKIKGEIENALHPGTPVFFRVDLLKALINDYMITSPTENAKYCMVTDFDVEPMTPQESFDQHTVNNLSSAGYVFNEFLGSLENSFFIFNKEKEDLRRIHYETIIQKTASTILSNRNVPINRYIEPEDILKSQFVYMQYRNFQCEVHEEWPKAPRKPVVGPISQFAYDGKFKPSDHQAESFHFIGDSNVPFTRNGRSITQNEKDSGGEVQIEALKDWKAEPLDPPKET